MMILVSLRSWYTPTQTRFRSVKNAAVHKMPEYGIQVPAFFKGLLMEYTSRAIRY